MMTDSFGARLRRQRERRQITLSQIAATTKINASLFEGLERDNVSRWPGGIFRRSFIRVYAQAIGLDPEETCREFVERFPEPGDVPPESAGAAASGTVAAGGAATGLSGVPRGRGGFAQSASAWSNDEGEAQLRLTLADPDLPSRVRDALGTDTSLIDVAARWRTVALDLGTVLIVALTAFTVFDRFWMPLAVTSVVYYVGASLLWGATPAALFFANSAPLDGTRSSTATTSLERALEMRDVLMADARPRAATPPLHQPVDIEARRVRA